MKRNILLLLMVLSQFSVAQARGVFEYERIDFFAVTKVLDYPVQEESTQSPEIIVDEWAEPVISPSGKVSIYLPPKEVRDFLDKPDAENAKAYLQWNLKRIKKFVIAQGLLAKEAKELGSMKEAKGLLEDNYTGGANGVKDVKAGVNYLFYFMLNGCPACEKESRVIKDIYLNHPEIRIEAFANGFSEQELEGFGFSVRQDNGMSRLFKVNSYPTVAVFNRKNQGYFLSGFVEKNKILKLFE